MKRKPVLPNIRLNRLKAKLHPNPLHNFRTLNIAVFELKERTNTTSAFCVHLNVSILLQGHRSVGAAMMILLQGHRSVGAAVMILLQGHRSVGTAVSCRL
jgi:hypothetical protein